MFGSLECLVDVSCDIFHTLSNYITYVLRLRPYRKSKIIRHALFDFIFGYMNSSEPNTNLNMENLLMCYFRLPRVVRTITVFGGSNIFSYNFKEILFRGKKVFWSHYNVTPKMIFDALCIGEKIFHKIATKLQKTFLEQSMSKFSVKFKQLFQREIKK